MKATISAIQTDQILKVIVEYGEDTDPVVLHPERVSRILLTIKDSQKNLLRNAELSSVYANSDGKFYWSAIIALEESPSQIKAAIETVDGEIVLAECEIIKKADTILGKMF
jgi:hypothetical protein